MARSLFYEIGVDLKLTAIAIYFGLAFGAEQVGLLFSLEVDDLDCLALAADEVDGAFEDVRVFNQRDINLCLSESRLVLPLALDVERDLPARCFQNWGC